MWYVPDVLYAVLYVRVNCLFGCCVSRRYIDVCYCDMFSVVNLYLDHLKFCVVCINSLVLVNVMLSLMSVMSRPPALCNRSVRTAVKLCIWGVSALGVSLVP